MKNHSKQRETILEILKESYSHPTADEIYAEAKKTLPNISLGTIYRNLDELVKHNIIKKISTTSSKDRYDYPKSEHCHAVCFECGNVNDIELTFNTDEIQNQVFAQSKIESDPKDIIIMGICEDCQIKNRRKI